MAYRCTKNSLRECDGCMACKPEETFYCPICGDEIEDRVYTTSEGEVVGCENCIQIKDPEDVLDGET